MKHITLTPFGQRPVTADQVRAMQAPGRAGPAVNKWALLARLRVARAGFGLTDRDLTVLAALLSFLPAGELVDGAPLIVFPSNASLSDRAHGMAESTLRRHLAALVAAGLLWRHDSPNGKRFARRGRGGELAVAFGLDLTPLARAADRIASRAAATQEAAQALHLRREALVLRLRDTAKLLALGLTPPEAEASLAPLRRALRRQMTEDRLAMAETALADLHSSALALAGGVDAETADTPDLAGTAAHSGRHQQESRKENPDSEPCPESGRTATDHSPGAPLPPIDLVIEACPDILPYLPPRAVDWAGLIRAAATVRPQMGISPDAWQDAVRVMGAAQAGLVVAAILQRFSAIRSAGGYLRALTNRAREGRFLPGPMIMALLTARTRES